MTTPAEYLRALPPCVRRKVYVASSWRNSHQPAVVEALRADGHHVYDFRHPAPGNTGFAWSAIDPNWQRWTVEEYRAALDHPIARAGFALDRDALSGADTTVLVMPCGRSAHLEAGFAMGRGQRVVVYLPAPSEPELMYLLGDARIVATLDELLQTVRGTRTPDHHRITEPAPEPRP